MTSKKCFFLTDLAYSYGLHEALMCSAISSWFYFSCQEKNLVCHDGNLWIQLLPSSLVKKYPFISYPDTIHAINSLSHEGLIWVTGTPNLPEDITYYSDYIVTFTAECLNNYYPDLRVVLDNYYSNSHKDNINEEETIHVYKTYD